MQRNRIHTAFLILVATLCIDANAASDGTANGILKKAGINSGVACVVGCNDGELVLELAHNAEFLIMALASDPASVARTEQQVADAGVLGRRVYVAQGTTKQIPFADNYIDVLVLTDVQPNELDEEARQEIMRVLTPVRGRAIIGDRVLSKPPLPGADDWTHRLHGPDNNPVSSDTAFQMPAMLQHLAMPMQTSFQGTTLVAGGRRIELSDWVTKKPDRNAIAGKLTARSLYNGQTLWQRDLPENLEPDTPICALDAERIYVAAGDSCRVLVIDAETGKDLPCITLSDENLRVKWLGIEDGRLHALLGPPLPVRAPRSYMMGGPNRAIRSNQAAAGTTLVAWDLSAKREVWRHEESVTIDYRTVAMRAGRTYFYSEATRLACLSPDGKLLWENHDESWLKTLERPERIRNGNYESTATLIVGPSGQLRLSLPGLENGLTFNADNGRLLWNDTVRGPKCFFVGDRYFSPRGIFKASTGTQISPSYTIGGGCGIVTWVPGLDQGLGHVALGVKSPCGVGAFAAGGTLAFSPSQCDCWPHLRGAASFSSGGDLFRRAKENPEHPLVPSTVSTTSATALPGDWPQYRGDLKRSGTATTPAGDEARVRWIVPPEKPFPVPEGHEMHRAEWLDRPTAPITAGGLAIHGCSDGSVRAVQIEDGQPGWTFWTGGPVLTSPAVANGRVYVGSGDGWVYCLGSNSGELIWKWRGAPIDRRVNIYGKLTSLWPIAAVVVDRGNVFGVAGQAMQNGSVTFAIDAVTGKANWTKWTEPEYESRKILQRADFGFGPAGQLTVLGEHLVVRTYLGIPAVFHAKTGARIPPSEGYRELSTDAWSIGFRTATSGQDLIVLDDNTILQGGYPLLGNPDIRHDKSAAKFVAWRIEDNGMIPVEPLPWWAIPHSQIPPALDASHVVLVGGVGRTGRSENSTIGLSLWSREEWQSELQRLPEATDEPNHTPDPKATPFAIRRARQAAMQAKVRRFKTSLDMSKADWRIDDVDVSAVVLSEDAVVAVLGMRSFARSRTHPGFTNWRLAAFDRKTGEERWSVDLPGEPIMNGIAPSGEGAWLLTLRDGSVVAVGQ